MPILGEEPSYFPEDLFEPNAFSEKGGWYVLHTRPRQEKSLARNLRERKVAYYLPMLAKRVKIRNQIVKSYHPLFAGYIFMLGQEESRLIAAETRRIAATLDVGDQAKLWTDLRQIHRLLDSGLPINGEERLVPGTAVEVRDGPLMGMRGVIVNAVSGKRFIVQVDFIQRGASVMMDESMLAVCLPLSDAAK